MEAKFEKDPSWPYLDLCSQCKKSEDVRLPEKTINDFGTVLTGRNLGNFKKKYISRNTKNQSRTMTPGIF